MISVIVPIYNVAEYLPACIESILSQTYKNLEIILVDDGSSDKSGEICDYYAKRDTRCIVIHQSNKGVAEARNIGLECAKGKYISFIDGDDYIHPKMLATLYEALQQEDYDFSMIAYKKTQKYYIEKEPKVTGSTILSTSDLMKGLYNVFSQKISLPDTYFQLVWNKLYKRSLINSLKFISTGSEDAEFNNKIYLKTRKAIFVNQQLYYWVQRASSITHQPVNKNFIDRAYSYLLCLNQIPKNHKEYRAYCLEKLYRTTINIQYRAKNTKIYNYAIETAKELKAQTINEFISNKHINIFHKINLLVFYYIPLTYHIFIKLLELKHQLTNKKNENHILYK